MEEDLRGIEGDRDPEFPCATCGGMVREDDTAAECVDCTEASHTDCLGHRCECGARLCESCARPDGNCRACDVRPDEGESAVLSAATMRRQQNNRDLIEFAGCMLFCLLIVVGRLYA